MAKGKISKNVKKASSVKKSQLKQKKKVEVLQNFAKMSDAAPPRETAHELFKRHAAERKKVKIEVEDLKRQRMKLPKKGNKEDKKALTQRIWDLQEELEKRHTSEKEAFGILRDSLGEACGKESSSEGDDEDVDI